MRAARDRASSNQRFAEEAEQLRGSLSAFTRAAWHVVEPKTPLLWNWHHDAVCDLLESVSRGEVRKAQIWVPPGTTKSSIGSIAWPVWEWTWSPGVRYLCGSYDIDLSTRFAVRSRGLIESPWFQARFRDAFALKAGENQKRSYANDRGGERFATSPTGGATGRHAHRIMIDDPIDASKVTSELELQTVIDWYDGKLSTRAADPKTYAEVIIMQRLHEKDLAAHALEMSDDWEILCLPERYEAAHPFVSPVDIRTEDGQLLWPERFDEKAHQERARKLGAHRAAGQLQQRPAAREGELLKRSHFRYFDPRPLDEDPGSLPFFRLISSWDTAFKDKTTSDYVVGTVWGTRGADRFLLRKVREQMRFGATKRAIKEIDAWMRATWPGLPVHHVIEKSANGVDVIAELKREITGVVEYTAATDKILRAEAAEPCLEAGNVWLPGWGLPDGSDYDARTPAWVQEFVEELVAFNNGEHDDQVDSWSQAMNWLNAKGSREATFSMPSGT